MELTEEVTIPLGGLGSDMQDRCQVPTTGWW